jgi:hypothetical protein
MKMNEVSVVSQVSLSLRPWWCQTAPLSSTAVYPRRCVQLVISTLASALRLRVVGMALDEHLHDIIFGAGPVDRVAFP